MESFNHFDEISKSLETKLSKLIDSVAAETAREVFFNAPLETGRLRRSVYYNTSKKSTYADYARSEEKRAARKEKRVVQTTSEELAQLPEVERPTDKLTANIAVGAPYAAYVEYGTNQRAPHPYFAPAIEHAREKLEGYMAGGLYGIGSVGADVIDTSEEE